MSTFDRADLLRKMLESLCQQTLDRLSFEVVLVDDGSGDDTREVARSFELRLPLRYSRQRHAGLASARNHGIFLASGELVLFLDDDCVATRGLLEAHCAAHRRFAAAHYGVLGRVECHHTLASDPLLQFLCEADDLLAGLTDLREGTPLDFSHFRGGRSSCKRSFLLEHGVFNPAFRFACDDTELAWRLSRHGFGVVYEPRAVTTRARKIAFDELCRSLQLEGESRLALSRLHPEDPVQRWTGVSDAESLWEKVGPVFEALLRSARELDRIVRLRREAGLTVDERDVILLHRGYWTARRACMVKGIVERAAVVGHERV